MGVAHLPDTIHVRYVVPGVAVVELATRTVTRVIVDDEAIHLADEQEVAEPDDAPPGPAERAAIDAAIEVAETVSWPGWEFGW